MNILSKKIIPLIFITTSFSGCFYYYDVNDDANIDHLKHKNGKLVSDCNGHSIDMRGGAERFWKQNNLPKGTTEFVCKNGKAYLPNQVPSGQ